MAKTQVDELVYCVKKCKPLSGDETKMKVDFKDAICLSNYR